MAAKVWNNLASAGDQHPRDNVKPARLKNDVKSMRSHERNSRIMWCETQLIDGLRKWKYKSTKENSVKNMISIFFRPSAVQKTEDHAHVESAVVLDSVVKSSTYFKQIERNV